MGGSQRKVYSYELSGNEPRSDHGARERNPRAAARTAAMSSQEFRRAVMPQCNAAGRLGGGPDVEHPGRRPLLIEGVANLLHLLSVSLRTRRYISVFMRHPIFSIADCRLRSRVRSAAKTDLLMRARDHGFIQVTGCAAGRETDMKAADDIGTCDTGAVGS